jgi:hypothetical protein
MGDRPEVEVTSGRGLARTGGLGRRLIIGRRPGGNSGRRGHVRRPDKLHVGLIRHLRLIWHLG